MSLPVRNIYCLVCFREVYGKAKSEYIAAVYGDVIISLIIVGLWEQDLRNGKILHRPARRKRFKAAVYQEVVSVYNTYSW